VATRILVIEDNPASLELVSYLLQQAGREVLAAKDAETGLRLALDCRPDLILCDLQLPGMDGLQFVRKLKDTAGWGPAKVVALTAYSMPGDRETALAAGFDDYMTKPIDPETFLRDVDSYLPAATAGR
jgi:CheY-like chemotaxis protein